jgi:hypothetical protein
MNIIDFVALQDIDETYNPVPSNKIIPNWYKKMDPYVAELKHPTTMTVKKCIPVFDAITSGYTILLHCDLNVRFVVENGERKQITEWSNLLKDPVISSHDFVQFSEYPGVPRGVDALKYISPFGIVTPPGYSCLLTQPMHQDYSPIKIFEGVVDTDKEHKVFFPFVYKNPHFEGLIPAGTPIVQVIPFKRENWKIRIDDEQALKTVRKQEKKIGSSMFAQYKNLWWTKKEYR